MADAPPADQVLAKTLIPQDLHDRPYLKPWLDKPWSPELAGEVFKKLDGAESLIGKKTLIPAGDDPKEWDGFLSKMRPEKADDYEIKLGEGADLDFVKSFREASHHAGLNKVQLNRQLEKLIPALQARGKAQADAQAAQEAEFDALVKAAVGPEFEKKSARVQAAIKELAPEGTRKFIDALDNKAMVLLVGLVDGVLSKYAGEDDFTGKGGAGGSGAADKDTLIKELHTIYASDGWKDFRHGDHEKTKKRVDEILASAAFK